MLQLDPAFSERAYGAGSFSDFVEKLKKADFINVSGSGGRYIIERRGGGADKIAARPEDALPALRDVFGNASHGTGRRRRDRGRVAGGMDDGGEIRNLSPAKFGFQPLLRNCSTTRRTKPWCALSRMKSAVWLCSSRHRFYPPALPPPPVAPEPAFEEEEKDEPQPIVEGQPTIFEPNPPPPKPKKVATRKRAPSGASARARRPRKRKD